MARTAEQRERRRTADRERRARLTPEQRAAASKRREQAKVDKYLGVGIRIGVSSGAPLPASPRYPVNKSLSAMVANPWVWTAVQAISTDLSGLPLVAVKDGKQLPSHWMLDLLKRPNPQVSGLELRKQLYADFALARNAYLRVWRDGSGRPFQLARIHPNKIQALELDDGLIAGWTLTDTGKRLGLDEVLRIADISWTDDASVAYGQTVIEPLALGIQVDADVRKQAGKAARRGRLEMLLTPDGPLLAMPEEATRAIVEEYQTATETGRGVYVVGRNMKATPLSLTARDAEFAAISDRTRDEILAAFGVPEVRAGKPSANYGTAVQQMRTYWESRQHDAALFEAQWSRLAEGEGVEIRHSFRQVAALQSSNTERLARVVTHISNGMDPADAYVYEGFLDVPALEAQGVEGEAPPQGPPDVTQPREPKAAIGLVLREIGGMYGNIGADEPLPDWLPMFALSRLRSVLPDVLATDAAQTVHEAVEGWRRDSPGQSWPGALRCFSPGYAASLSSFSENSDGAPLRE
jgi:HK97 family phage portal protein